MSLTEAELRERFPKATDAFIRLNLAATDGNPPTNRPASATVAKPRDRDGSLAAREAQDRNSAFYVVRVTSFRSRLLDTDNLVAKWHVDALRYSGILPQDTPERARIEASQEKVGRKDQERTEIEIVRLTPAEAKAAGYIRGAATLNL